MNLTLKRREYRDDGIFSDLFDERGIQVATTLEHSYARLPKIPPGAYTCVRSLHKLHGMTEPFETFEIQGVAGHQGLLFHWGNYNRDSEGCVLVGQAEVGAMITESRKAFAAFLLMQAGLPSFTLTVVA